jgi:choline dehydrogenase-like flavoprotein
MRAVAMVEMLTKQADVAVVGSGPGGATVARQLSRAGKRVLLLERGHDHRGRFYYGSHLGALIYGDKNSLLFTEEGLNIVRPIMTGGATNMYCGAAARPPAWFKGKYGVDIARYVEETIDELRIGPLPSDLQGSASRLVMETAVDLGYDWQPMMKFMNPARAARFDCGAKCMLGCRCGAKWTANEYVDDAVAAGCELVTCARADRLIIEDGRVLGVVGKLGGKQPFEVRAEVVVLAAGGIGTPLIMQNSGFFNAGNGMAMDVTVMVYGVSKERGNAFEPPMTVAYVDDENCYMLSTLIDPWFLYPMITALKGPKYPLSFRHYRNTLGLMIKIKDDVSGTISMEGRISKPMTSSDRYRLNHAAIVCRKILVKAGCDPDSIFVSPQRGTHPSCTVRIGEMVDTNLQTEVKNLYVCDASTFPEALDRPTVLTIISLGKRLSDHLLTTVFRREAETRRAERRREAVAPEPVAVSPEPLEMPEPPSPSPAS